MAKSLEAEYVEEIPSTEPYPDNNAVWHLPVFCVEQEKLNVTKYRLVYDASAKYHGVSLNDALLQGPDFNNLLRSVLLRFREKSIAFGADIQAMFNNFKVPIEQRNYLRFFWFAGNNPENKLVPYRATSHIFGCTSSPAVANCGLKFLASQLPIGEEEVANYLDRCFYVDDGFCSTDSPAAAIDILSKTKSHLEQYNIKLHKVVSNSTEVVDYFPKDMRSTSTTIPAEKSNSHALGVEWNTDQDEFVITPNIPSRPFTKRGILSVINSLYDPIGLASPVILQGRLIQREILLNNPELSKYDWDDKLPDSYYSRWSIWISSLSALSEFKVPRGFYPKGFTPFIQELHTFSDSSEMAIGHVSFMRSIDSNFNIHVSFISSSSKLCPRAATTMPRLELCAAVEASKAASALCRDLNCKPDKVFLHTDSKIVIGYLTNRTRSFSKYVERRATIIQNLFPDNKWLYVNTKNNPADHASRPQRPEHLLLNRWFEGPLFLWDPDYSPDINSCQYLDIPIELPEEKPEVKVMLTSEVAKCSFLSVIFQRIGSLLKMISVVTILVKFARSIDGVRQKLQIPIAPRSMSISQHEAVEILIRAAQEERYATVISTLSSGNQLSDNHKLSELSPQLDTRGILRVGGRLKHSNLAFSVKYPYLIPENHPLALAIISHFHLENRHQGTHISHGSVIQAGYFVENGRQSIRKFIASCVICKKLRGLTSQQLMADLPAARVEETPVFSHVGTDVFGPFYIHQGKSTRRTSATKKIWALIFVCLPSRAIHLEPLMGMDTSSFRNALSRFMSVRGSVKSIRSDQGTNFTSAKKQLESIDVDAISSELSSKGIQWTLNPPYSSHFSGSWERKIGSVRRVFEATILLANQRFLSLDEFMTYLAESANIVNNTPLWSVPTKADDPTPLTPNMLITLRSADVPQSLESFSEEDIFSFGPKRYRKVQHLCDQFWLRWRSEYLQTLTARHKWKKKQPCITAGDIVLVKYKNLSRNDWPMGRVTDVKPSSDGLIRSAHISIAPLPGKSQNRTINRAIHDLVLLIPTKSHHCLNPASQTQDAGGVSNP